MNCLTKKISILGLCENNNEYSVLLDEYGVSLNKLAKITDSIVNGKNLINSIIEDAVKQTIRGIQFDGMEIGKVVDSTIDAVLTSTNIPALTGTKYIDFDTDCETTAFYLGQIKVYGNGTTTISLVVDGVTDILFTGAITDKETIYLNRNIYSKSVRISIDMSAGFVPFSSPLPTCTNGYLITTNNATTDEGYGLAPSISLRCDMVQYFCQYADLIADVAKYKVLARIFHTLLYSDRLNEYVLFKDTDKLYELMSFYDSTYNIPALTGDVKSVPKGQYQIAMENIQIPRPECTCCTMKVVNPVFFKLNKF